MLMKSHCATPACIVVFLVAFVFGSCARLFPEARDALVTKLDALYDQYLESDLAGARQLMLEAVNLLKHDTTFSRKAQAHALWLAYARLHLVEFLDGKEDAALLAYEDARCWYTRRLHAWGETEVETAEALGAWTPNKCREQMMAWDRAHTHDQGAVFSAPRSKLGDRDQ